MIKKYFINCKAIELNHKHNELEPTKFIIEYIKNTTLKKYYIKKSFYYRGDLEGNNIC